MTTLKDNRRSVTGLRKQFIPNVKGKLWILAQYIDVNGRTVIKLSDSASIIFNKNIDIERAVFNSITKGIKLTVVENKFTSTTKLHKIINWGVKYGNNSVKIKRYSVRGKYRTGIWVKGQRGMVSNTKYNTGKVDKIKDIASDNNLIYDNEIWSNEF